MAQADTSQAPVVSVIIPTYNSAATIVRALSSVFAQTYPNIEVIVVDDRSHDNTLEVVEGLHNGSVNLIALDRNVGPAGARNRGIDAARGEYVAFLDSDDEWLPEKLAQQVDLLERRPEVSIVGCKAETISADGTLIDVFPSQPPVGADGWKGLMYSSWLSTICVVTRRALLDQERFDENLKVAEDRDLWIRLARLGDVAFVPEVLARVHKSPDSFMRSNVSRMQLDLVPLFERRVEEWRDELSRAERRRILGGVYSATGQGLLAVGETNLGRKYLLRAITLGHRVFENLILLVRG